VDQPADDQPARAAKTQNWSIGSDELSVVGIAMSDNHAAYAKAGAICSRIGMDGLYHSDLFCGHGNLVRNQVVSTS
jgi:hypothetical protein